MSSDENQQALAWQQIIKNRAFYNVRVQRGESWVDAACRTLDELIDQKEQAEKSLDQLEFKARIERATKSDMTFEEVKRAIESVKVLDQSKFAQFAAEAVMRIMADPPALVIRESQIDNVEVTSIDDGRFWLGDDALINACAYPTAEEVRESVEDLLASAAEAEAVARVIDDEVNSEDKRVEALADAWDEGNRAARIILPVNPPRYQTNPYRSGEGQ